MSFIFLISWISGPAQRPGIDKVHGTAIPCSRSGVSLCKVVIISMGTIATAVVIAEGNGPRISWPKTPARTTGSLPRMEVTGKTYRTSFPGEVSYISFEQQLAIHDSGQAKQGHFLLLHITTYYYALIHTGRLQTYFIAEGDVGTLDVNFFFLAVCQLLLLGSKSSWLYQWYVLLGKG